MPSLSESLEMPGFLDLSKISDESLEILDLLDISKASEVASLLDISGSDKLDISEYLELFE